MVKCQQKVYGCDKEHEELVTHRYTGADNIRDHILKMSNMASKLKPMDLELRPVFLVHLIFASLSKDFFLK